MLIPQVSPQRDYFAHKAEIDQAIADVLGSGWYILGRNVSEFEKHFASCIGSEYAIGVGNGTDAIEISLRSLGIGVGDIVFTVSHTAVASIAAIERAGAIPYLVDIHSDTFTMDANSLETAVNDILKSKSEITGRPSAIVPVHIYGYPVDMDSIIKIAEQYDLRIIEDCAQAHGAEISGKQVGTFGDTGAFSFYPTKNLGAIGDGGLVVTNHATLQAKLMALRQYGWEEKYISKYTGINTRLDELQAAVLNVKLRYLDQQNTRRREIANKYTEALINTPIKSPFVEDHVKHVYHQYVIQHEDRNALSEYLKKNSIATAIHYPLPVHLQPIYKNKIGISSQGLTNTENVVEKILSLPMYPQLSNKEVDYICRLLKEFKG